jgi:two-component system sensor histidine kinase DesK
MGHHVPMQGAVDERGGAGEGWDFPNPTLRVAAAAALGFLAFPLVSLANDDPSGPHVAVVLAGLVVFVALYAVGIGLVDLVADLRHPAAAGVVAAMFALSLALALADRSDWSGLFIYTGTVAAVRLPQRVSVPVIAACVVAAGLTTIPEGAGAAVQAALWCVAVDLLVLGATRVARLYAELQAARDQVARLAVADERLRFARDLHDLRGHSLSLIALKSELAGRLLPGHPERAAAEVADIEHVTREALAEVREAVGGYRAPTLAGELANARRALAAAGIEVALEWPEVPLAAGTEAVLAWAVREASTNVIRHSGAERCAIRLRDEAGVVALEVSDDGRGGAARGDGRGGGAGLAGLAERVERGGGRLEAGARDTGGFTVRVAVPNGGAP